MPPIVGSIAAADLRERISALSARERRLVAAGGAAVLLFLLYLLWPRGEEPAVEIAQPSEGAAQPTFSAPLPPPAPVAPAPAAPLPAAAAAPAAAGVILRGVMGGGASGGAAIFAFPDGSQRVVRIGRDLLPGTTLREVGLRHVIASSGAGDIRLEINKPGASAIAAARDGTAPMVSPSISATSSPQQQRETTQFRLGLQPMRRNGRVSGYAIRPGAAMPRLQAAGLRPGDVLVRVNGSDLDEERLLELSWQLSNSGSTEFEFIRNGQRMKTSLGTAK